MASALFVGDCTQSKTVINPTKFKVFDYQKIGFFPLSDWITAGLLPPLGCLSVVRHN